MERHEFDRLEIEANAQGSHHIHVPRGYDAKRLLDRVHREALEQLEPGQNLGAFPFEYMPPCNTLR